MPKLPLSPGALYGVLKEFRTTTEDTRPLVVAGARELVPVLRRELTRGGDASAVRDGGTFERAAGLVYVLASEPGETDERELGAADRARIPIVCVLAGPGISDAIPYVLATSVVRVEHGAGFPVEEIARVLAGLLGDDATALAARLPVLRRPVCDALVASYARKNGLVGAAVFVPGADFPILTLNQIRLVLRIAAVYGQELSGRRALELVGVLGGGLGLRALARELLDLVPVAGWAVKGAIAYGGTLALGQAAVRYFEVTTASATPPQQDGASHGAS